MAKYSCRVVHNFVHLIDYSQTNHLIAVDIVTLALVDVYFKLWTTFGHSCRLWALVILFIRNTIVLHHLSKC